MTDSTWQWNLSGTHQSIKYVGWCRCAGEPWATESWFKGHWRTAHQLNPFPNSLNMRASIYIYTYNNADRARARYILHSLCSILQVAMIRGMGLYYQLFPAWSGDTEGACALSADSACCNLQVLPDDHPAWEQKTCLIFETCGLLPATERRPTNLSIHQIYQAHY